MTLNEYAANLRKQILEDLRAGKPPSVGSFSLEVLKAGLASGAPQMGTTRYEPQEICLEFIFAGQPANSTVFEVQVSSPERIVWMPVPAWVIEQVWEGEVTGSFHFESTAKEMVEDVVSSLQPEANMVGFGVTQPKRRG